METLVLVDIKKELKKLADDMVVLRNARSNYNRSTPTGRHNIAYLSVMLKKKKTQHDKLRLQLKEAQK